MMLNKPRIKTWAQPNLMCEPTRIELRQDLINSAMTPMFKATALEVRNDQKIQSFQPNSTGFNPMTPFRLDTVQDFLIMKPCTYVSSGNKHYFTNQFHYQTYQNYEQPPQRSQNSDFQSFFRVENWLNLSKKNFLWKIFG